MPLRVANLLSTLLAACVCPALAYAAPSPQAVLSPESCLVEIDELAGRAYREAARRGQEVDRTRLRRETEKIASKCASSYPVASVRAEQLPALARLYFEAGQPARAHEVVGRYLKLPLVGEAAKAELLLRAIGFSIDYAADAGNVAYAESYLKKLGSLGDDFVREQMRGRLQLVRHYLTAGNGADALKHEAEIVKLSGKLKPDERKAASAEVVEEISLLALIKCSEDGPDKALTILRQLPPELVSLSGTGPDIAADIARYSLAGQPAPRISPRYVLNNAGGAAELEARGRVTVMLFATHWCGPCRAVYPQVASLYERYRDEGLRVVLVTQLYGFFGERKELKPDDEAAALRDYYAVEMKLPFPILVEDSSQQGQGDRAGPGAPGAGHEYLFSFIPQVLVVDKSGRTRGILLGTPPGQGKRLRTKVEELLKESRGGRDSRAGRPRLLRRRLKLFNPSPR